MKRRTRIFLLLLGIVAEIAFIYWSGIFNVYFDLAKKPAAAKDRIIEISLKEINKRINAPDPIYLEKEVDSSLLTREGIIDWTNFHRNDHDLNSLLESEELNKIAEMKITDMFEKQYFAHVSPEEKDISDLTKEMGYQFIIVGENLARGGFEDDENLVRRWMESPGHRENILNENYQEIGVAARKGMFEGEEAWLAVQVFATPLSACPEPDQEIEHEISIYQEKIDNLEIKINALKEEIKYMYPKRGQEYKERVNYYNILIEQYNALVSKLKPLISEYNNEVNLFNECLSEY